MKIHRHYFGIFELIIVLMWKSARIFRYKFWLLVHCLPYRVIFKSVAWSVKFNGWVRVEKPLSNITVNANTMIGKNCYLLCTKSGKIQIGRDVGVNDYCYITSNYEIIIEDDVRIAEFVSIRDYDHEFFDISRPIHTQGLRGGPIRIGRGAWIGRGVMVTSGVTIGEGAVIGANSVVTKDIAAWAVAVGAPAKEISNRITRYESK